MTLLIPAAVFVICLTLGLTTLRGKFGVLVQMTAMFIIAYSLVVGRSVYYDNIYWAQLRAYDVNGNGSFEQSEQVEGFEEAEHRVIADTGRRFAPVLGFIVSALFSLLLGAIIKLASLRSNQ